MYTIAWIFAGCVYENFNIIIPILINKNGDTSAKSNYRSIAIVTAMSKIFELCLSRIMDVYLFTGDNQFCFKQKTLY